MSSEALNGARAVEELHCDRPVFCAITVDDIKVGRPEQAIGIVDDNFIHFSVADVGSLIDDMGIDVKLLTDRAMHSTNNYLVPKGNFELLKGKERPVVSMLFAPGAYQPMAAKVRIEAAFTSSELTSNSEDLKPFQQIVARVSDTAACIERSFVAQGATPVAYTPREPIYRQFSPEAVHLSMRLSRYSSVLIGKYFQENNIPGLYVNNGCGEKTKYSHLPAHHSALGLHGYLKWSSPARTKDALVNVLQLSAHLRGRKLPFSEEEIKEFAWTLNH